MRKTPRWGPGDPPYRPLQDIFDAAQKACRMLSIGVLENVLGCGRVPIIGHRDDLIGARLPDRIEGLIAKAYQRSFLLSGDEIFATYPSDSFDRSALFGPDSVLALSPFRWPVIKFYGVRVHWPKLVEALQEAGFEIGIVQPKPAEKRSARPAKPPGPKRGSLRRYESSDRALFPDIRCLMMSRHISATEAARRLARGEVAHKKVEGHGTAESRAKRLAGLYLADPSRSP